MKDLDVVSAQLLLDLNLASLTTSALQRAGSSSVIGTNNNNKSEAMFQSKNECPVKPPAVITPPSALSKAEPFEDEVAANDDFFEKKMHDNLPTNDDDNTMELTPPMAAYRFKQSNERKRRRAIGNLDNTLDGLVAKRADINAPVNKRYQTETEAIELPDDKVEIKKMETDPDVSTRMCSICGYQGKWVSEMIRHKRVHTSERPFKCKYCNRTSKWKADLIRHVAKTHGIRVVSKYSRSKVFEATSTDEKFSSSSLESYDAEFHLINSDAKKGHRTRNNLVTRNSSSQISSLNSVVGNNRNSGSLLPPVIIFRCTTCFFEQESFAAIMDHLNDAHNKPPFQCSECNKIFYDVKSAMDHDQADQLQCSHAALKLNFTMMNGVVSSLGIDRHQSTNYGFPSMVLSADALNSQSPTLSVQSATESGISTISPTSISTHQTRAESLEDQFNNIANNYLAKKQRNNNVVPVKEVELDNVMDLSIGGKQTLQHGIFSERTVNYGAPIRKTDTQFLLDQNLSERTNFALWIIQSRIALANLFLQQKNLITSQQWNLTNFSQQPHLPAEMLLKNLLCTSFTSKNQPTFGQNK